MLDPPVGQNGKVSNSEDFEGRVASLEVCSRPKNRRYSDRGQAVEFQAAFSAPPILVILTSRPQGVRSGDDGRDLAELPASNGLRFASQTAPLGIRETEAFSTELPTQNAVFFLRVLDYFLLMSAQPARQQDDENLEW
jgi:hypothetical protein